jgi:hypothetical protein
MRFVQRAVMLAAAGLLAAGGAAVAAPAAAQAGIITGPGTQVTFSGTGGDPVTGDQSWSYDLSNSEIDAFVSADGNHVSVAVHGDTFWDLDFAAPQGQALTAGTVYDNATRYPFQDPAAPGLDFEGNGVGCNTLTGSFTVISASFGPNGWIQSFDATFTQHCEGNPDSAATGEVVLNNGPAPPALAVTVTPAGTDQVSHTNGQVTLTGTVTCNRPASVGLNGTLNQRLTRTTLATGSWFTNSIVCGTSPTTWTATVIPNGSVPFGDGKAEIDGSYSANDQVYGVFVTGSISQQVKLNRS